MKKTGAKRLEAPGDEPEAGSLRRQSCREDRDPGFDRSLDSLQEDESDAIVADLQAFMADWRRGKTDSELYESWDYKTIQGNDDAQKYRVRQIRLGIARKFRVFLTAIPQIAPCVWFLEVCRRDKNQTDEARLRAIRRAKTLWGRFR